MTNIPEITLPFVDRAPRLMPVDTDSMEPTLQKGDFTLAVPVDSFQYDAIYVAGGQLYRVTAAGENVTLRKDNKKYGSQKTTRAEFDAAVDAMVVGYIKVLDPRYFRERG